MRVAIITGGRDQSPTAADRDALLVALKAHDVTHVLHGACKGVDMWAHWVVKAAGIWVMAMPALWDTQGKVAGPKRNVAMADVATWMTDANAWEPARPPVCIAFPGGVGTKNMTDVARSACFEMVEIGGCL